MNMLFDAAVMGVVQGITEFLPISSTGHLIIVNHFIQFKEPFASMFEVVIQLGSILSVVVYFWKRLVPFGKGVDMHRRRETFELWKKTAAAVVPAIIIGGTIGKMIQEHLYNIHVVAGALLVGGIILIVIENRRKKVTIEYISQLSYGVAVAIGLIQCIAMVPGTSRSAATIIGAMLLGASRTVAAEFSFFLAIPTMAAASAYSLLKHGAHLEGGEWAALAVGFIVSFFVAWAVIAVFMKFIGRHDFKPFGYYRIALGLLIVLLTALGVNLK